MISAAKIAIHRTNRETSRDNHLLKQTYCNMLSLRSEGNIVSQAEAATGLGSNALLIVLGIAGIVLLALIAGVLLMRRKGEDEYDYEEEGPYRRE